jgi:signal transduction histidine kinase/ActR/RegA family two-component response regulator
MDLFPELKEQSGGSNGSGTPAGAGSAPQRELRLPQPDGQCLVYEASANLIFGPQGPVLLLDARDVTERNRATEGLRETAKRLEDALAQLRSTQQQVVQQERLRALEKMASGVAHDFNNVLAKILGFNELLLTWPENLNDKDKVKKYLQMVSASAQDAVKIVNRLREFYRHRKEGEVYQAVDLAPVIEQSIVLTQPKWKDQAMAAGIMVRIELDWQEIPYVRGSFSDLREVLINLIFNSVEAMPKGGTITIATRVAGDRVTLSVRDTGTGMSDEVRQRCLEPFFSTKHQQGCGLGLAIVYGIVQRHNGSLEIRSEAHKGTTVEISLPVHDEADSEPALPEASPQRPLNVLVVEDDPQVRDIEAEYLRGDGHAVTTAATGSEGLQRFRADQFDLVVSDRAMPEMSGDQLTEAIKSFSPGTPVIMVTGFADMPRDKQNGKASPDLVLRKPITQASLHEAIAKMVIGGPNQG